MTMKLDIQLFGSYADANLVLDQATFQTAADGVRSAHKQLDDAFSNQVAKFSRDMHSDVWADGNCMSWFAGEFTTKTKAQLENIAQQFNNILEGLDGLWSNVAADLRVGKNGSSGTVSTAGNVDVSPTQTETFDDGTSGRRQYSGKAAQNDMDELTSVLEPARNALYDAISKIGIYDNLGGNKVQNSVNTAIQEINRLMADYSKKISDTLGEVMSMTDEQYNSWATELQVSVAE